MGNVEVAWEDVVSVLNLACGHIGALTALLAAMVAAIVFAAVKLKKPLKGFVQWQSVIAFVALTAFVVNTMLTGPLYRTSISLPIFSANAARDSFYRRLR